MKHMNLFSHHLTHVHGLGISGKKFRAITSNNHCVEPVKANACTIVGVLKGCFYSPNVIVCTNLILTSPVEPYLNSRKY